MVDYGTLEVNFTAGHAFPTCVSCRGYKQTKRVPAAAGKEGEPSVKLDHLLVSIVSRAAGYFYKQGKRETCTQGT